MKRTDQSIIVYNRRDSSLKSVGSYRVEQNDLEIVGNVLRKCASSYMRTSSFHEVFINNLLKSHLPTVIPGFSKKKLMLLQSVELIAQVFHSNWDLMTNQFISDKIWERSNDIVTSMHEILNCVALSENIKISDKALLICLLVSSLLVSSRFYSLNSICRIFGCCMTLIQQKKLLWLQSREN